ncbi:MAG: prepilin-type N-terminal cleavage/methylation domain-containing protein [Candidatus Omnitrophota bacterium]|jgi:prepilin-type N-terminal cleavage/methylation domain-containing protein
MSPGYYKKSLTQKEHGFTLIELIIVIVIIGILALIALPKYYANIDQAEKSKVYTNLSSIRQVAMAYYAVYGAWPADKVWPITVQIDGVTVCKMSYPGKSRVNWDYNFGTEYCSSSRGGYGFRAAKYPSWSCHYTLCVDNSAYQTCTP